MNVVTSRDAFLQRRGFRPAAEMAAAHPHGSRVRYRCGCRCGECRAANTSYEKSRALARRNGEGNGIVSAVAARDHILRLRKAGVGRRAIAAASDVSDTVLQDLIAGRKAQIRALTERRILAVTKEMASDGAYIWAGPTWRRINQLLDEGFTLGDLAKRLGYRHAGLQFGKEQVTVRNAYEVEQLHRRLMS